MTTTIGRRVGSILALLALLVPAAPGLARPSAEVARPDLSRDDFDRERRAAEGRLVEELVGLSEWCGERRLYAERDEVWTRILTYDPDHARARKGLKYKKDRKGEWFRPKPYKEPKPSRPEQVEEFRRERTARTGDFVATMLRLLDGSEPPLPPGEVEAIHAELLAVDPDNPAVRARRGEVALEGSWVLAETVSAKLRRAELKTAAREALAATKKPERSQPTEAERELGVDWTHVLASSEVRVLGSGSAAEVERTARVAAAVEDFVRAALGVEVEQYEDYTIYLLARSDHEKGPFLANLPDLTEERRDFMRLLVGGGIQGTANTAWWCADEARRLDGATRHTIGNLLFRAWEIGVRHGWIWEGFGIYLTRELIGTRLIWYVQPSEYQLDDGVLLRDKLLDSKTNWMNAAYQMLKGESPPKLVFLLGKDVNGMVTEDMLLAYAFAAYLVEGRPAEAPRILARIGAGGMPHAVVEEELGLPLPDVQARLVRWLSERR